MRVKAVAFLGVLASLLASTTSWAVQAAPSSFTLAAQGNVSQGVTVKPVMLKPRVIGLVVYEQPRRTEVGAVLLGKFSGHPSIHWDLKVRGKLLSSGTYTIYCRVFANGEPTSIPAPPSRQLVISGRHVSVS
jgi:hypothetical protein